MCCSIDLMLMSMRLYSQATCIIKGSFKWCLHRQENISNWPASLAVAIEKDRKFSIEMKSPSDLLDAHGYEPLHTAIKITLRCDFNRKFSIVSNHQIFQGQQHLFHSCLFKCHLKIYRTPMHH
jgi:hypothetical protein